MSLLSQSQQSNLLLQRMSAADFGLLAPGLEPVLLPRHEMMCRAGERAAYAFFPTSGVGSLIAQSPEGLRVEAGLFGRDGFAPTAFAMDDDRSPFEGTMQLPGEGYRIEASRLRDAVGASISLRAILQRFAQALATQSGFTALSNAVHSVEERLARWVLMCDDRVVSGELGMTHEFMSVMLGVRRPSVTTALHVLEGNGLIRAERGLVIVRNRAALEEFAGDAYGAPEREYERLIGPLRG